VNVDVSTEQSIAELQEIADRLLESYGPVDDQTPDFFGEGGTGLPGFLDHIRTSLAKAQEYVRRCKEIFSAHLEHLKLVRRAQFLLSNLVGIDFHALVARIRLFFSRLVCIRVPLFEYGPELSGYRHRFR
jgi:hypothetical protein